MFDKKGVVSKHKQSKMFQSPSHDKMTTGHYNPAGTDHGVGIAPKIGTKNTSSKEVVPTRSKAYRFEDYNE